MTVNLHHCDFTQPLPTEQEHKPAQLTEAGLCLHYAATSAQHMQQLVHNLQALVLQKGKLIVTIPNSEFIMFCFRVQWVRVWSGQSWQSAFDALVLSKDDCVRAVHTLGGFNPDSDIDKYVPPEFVDKFKGDGSIPHRVLLERAMGVVDVPKCCTLVAQFRVSLEQPPCLGYDEFGKTYFFRLHSSVSTNTYCPEPMVPRKAWDFFAAAGFRACHKYQDVLSWLSQRENSSNEQIFRALGGTPIGTPTTMYVFTLIFTAVQMNVWKRPCSCMRQWCLSDTLHLSTHVCRTSLCGNICSGVVAGRACATDLCVGMCRCADPNTGTYGVTKEGLKKRSTTMRRRSRKKRLLGHMQQKKNLSGDVSVKGLLPR